MHKNEILVGFFLGAKYDPVYQIALLRHNFVKFVIEVAKKRYFNVFLYHNYDMWHVRKVLLQSKLS